MCGNAQAAATPIQTRNTTEVNVEFGTVRITDLRSGQMFKRAKSLGDEAVYMVQVGSPNPLNLETGRREYSLSRFEEVYPLPKGSLVKIVQG